ncbi:hypothetical protein JB92DRAFT_3042188 [Gautieria morchelliformis]|nr:hypothetical protein JB92DRAFT_3042188 [Gautieria morchelliformis]
MADASSTVRSRDYWYKDGDTVLSVTEYGVEHQFRVHRPILTIPSPVFRDMLRNNQNFVTLTNDSVDNVTALLGALYVGRKAQNVTFDVALRILKISHKYQLEGLQQSMKQKLLQDWPVKRSEYIARFTSLGSSADRLSQALKLIETAQGCQASELLPTAFYELACAWGNEWSDMIPHLSPENVARMWVGRARLERRLRPLVTLNTKMPPSMWTTTDKAESPITILQYRTEFGECKARLRQCVRVYHNNGDSRVYFCPSVFPNLKGKLGESVLDGMFVLTTLQQFRREDLGTTVCGSCTDWFMGILANKTEELWESIPAEFDLPEVNSDLYL